MTHAISLHFNNIPSIDADLLNSFQQRVSVLREVLRSEEEVLIIIYAFNNWYPLPIHSLYSPRACFQPPWTLLLMTVRAHHSPTRLPPPSISLAPPLMAMSYS